MSETTDAILAGLRGQMDMLIRDARAALEKAGAATAEQVAAAVRQEARPVLEELAARSRQLHAASSRPAALRALWITATGSVTLALLGAAGGYLYALDGHHGTLAWAESRQGREAHALDAVNVQLGGLDMFVECNGPGWRRIRVPQGLGYCWTYSAPRGQPPGGWVLPTPRPY
jgi:hypothetical protein